MKNRVKKLTSIVAITAALFAQQATAAFVNLDFEQLNGVSKPDKNTIVGFDTVNSDVTGWMNTTSGTRNWNGVYDPGNAELGNGCGTFRTDDPVDAYQIDGSTLLKTGDQITLKWYCRGGWSKNGKSEIQLMAAPQGDSSYTSLVSMVTNESPALSGNWQQYTFSYTVDSAYDGKYLAIRLGSAGYFPQIDNIKVTINTAMAIDDTGYITDANGALTIEDGVNDLLANDILDTTAVVKIANGTSLNGGTYSVAADGSFTYTSGYIGGIDSFSYDLVASQGGSVVSTGRVFISSKGLLHHYKFNEGTGTVLGDELGTANGTIAAETWSTPGHDDTDSALDFDGTTNKVTLGTNAALIGTTNFTISAWIKTSDTSASGVIIQQRQSGTSHTNYDGQYQFRTNTDGTLHFFTHNVSSGYGLNFDSSSTIRTGAWRHVAVVREGLTGKIYIDGVESGTATTTTKIPLINISVAIGADHRDNNKYFKGSIDEVQIYDVALTEAQINNIFTPVVGLELVQTGNELTWTLEGEIGVIKYQVINAETGELIEEIDATGKSSYTTTLPDGVKAKLVVVDNHGSQTYFPMDGNIVTTPYELVKGWNLIAITGDKADISKLESVAIGPLWAWNGSNYVRTTAPTATQAIWIDSVKETTVNVSAEKSEAKVTLNTGWNMVGPTNNESIPKGAMSVFTYDDTYNAITEQDKLLIRGVGYWIFAL